MVPGVCRLTVLCRRLMTYRRRGGLLLMAVLAMLLGMLRIGCLRSKNPDKQGYRCGSSADFLV
jgi:hypothetical protein